jgi:hypothetical protein
VVYLQLGIRNVFDGLECSLQVGLSFKKSLRIDESKKVIIPKKVIILRRETDRERVE